MSCLWIDSKQLPQIVIMLSNMAAMYDKIQNVILIG